MNVTGFYHPTGHLGSIGLYLPCYDELMGFKMARPALDRDILAERLYAIIDQMERSNFFEYADYPCICYKLDISDGFWSRELANGKSAFGQAIKKYIQRRNSIFMQLQRELDPARWIFLAKNWLQYADKKQYSINESKSQELKALLKR